MRCPACGEDYEITHECSAQSAAEPTAPEAPPPSGFAPIYYLRQAMAIARLDASAVRRAAKDRNALLYGLIFWGVGLLLVAGNPVDLAHILLDRRLHKIFFFSLREFFFFAKQQIVSLLAVYGISHLLARWLFGATGTFRALLRPMTLARSWS